MNLDNLNKYIDDAAGIYKETYSKLDAWHREKVAEGEKVKQRSYNLTNEAANEEHNAYIAKYNDMSDAIVSEHKGKIDSVREKYENEVIKYYEPDGNSLDAGDMALIKTGILSSKELFAMVLKHKDNTTMLRVIDKHIKENMGRYKGVPTDIIRALQNAKKDGEAELLAFHKFIQFADNPIRMAMQGLAGTESCMKGMLRLDEYAEDAKIDLVKAKLVLSEDDIKKIEEYTAKSKNYQTVQV